MISWGPVDNQSPLYLTDRAGKFPECQEVLSLLLGIAPWAQKCEGCVWSQSSWALSYQVRKDSSSNPIYPWTIANIKRMTRSGHSLAEKSRNFHRRGKQQFWVTKDSSSFPLTLLFLDFKYTELWNLTYWKWWLVIHSFNSLRVSLYIRGGLLKSQFKSQGWGNKNKENT